MTKEELLRLERAKLTMIQVLAKSIGEEKNRQKKEELITKMDKQILELIGIRESLLDISKKEKNKALAQGAILGWYGCLAVLAVANYLERNWR